MLFAEFLHQIFIESIFSPNQIIAVKDLKEFHSSTQQTWFSCLLDYGWGVLAEKQKCSYNHSELWTRLTEHSATVNGTFRDW